MQMIKNKSDYPKIVKFGRYKKKTSKLEAIEWIVLSHLRNYDILISKNIIDYRPFHDKEDIVIWKDSAIRRWLNEEFFSDAFNEEEKEKILSRVILNVKNPDLKTLHKSFNDNDECDCELPLSFTPECLEELGIEDSTEDKVTLLSINDCYKYYYEFMSKKNINVLKSKATAFVKDKMLAGYWLRDSGETLEDASYVNLKAEICTYGLSTTSQNGIRPVIAVKNDL